MSVAVVAGLVAVCALAWWLAHKPAPQAGFGGQFGARQQGRPPGGGPPGGFGGFGGFGGGQGGFRPPATTVGVAAAAVADMPVIIESLGTVLPTATVTVRPRVSGPIYSIDFKEGQIVEAGQLLATIDPRPYEAARMQAVGNLQHDQAALESARVTLKRDQAILEQHLIANQDVDTQASTVKQLEGSVVADQAAVETARLNLEFTRITSPVRGRVGLRVIDVGNYIAAGDVNGVAVVTVLDPIDVQFTVPQDEVPAIYQRQAQNKAPMPVTALDRTRVNELAHGYFLTLDNEINTSTGTVKAKARFSNAGNTLFPNQFVNVRLLLDTEKDAVVVPVGAVRTGAKGTFVYVLNRGASTVAMRSVKTGHSSVENVSILDGLKAGEEVITEGGDRLTDGASVQLPDADNTRKRPSFGGGNKRPPKGAGPTQPRT